MTKNIAVELILQNLKEAHMYFEQTMEGVTNEVAAYMPRGVANPIAGLYAHLVFSEDFFISFFFKKSTALYDGEWKDKTGISELQPTEWEKEYPRWLKSVKVDIAKAREYANAVYKVSEDYVAGLTDEDLMKEIDMSMFHMGNRTIGNVLSSMVVGHARDIMGEVSAIKGVQGLKGYPF